MAFPEELTSRHGSGRIFLHEDLLDLHGYLADLRPGELVYACGPAERFTARVASDSVNAAFEVELARSRRILPVAADESILSALLAAGVDVPYYCTEGICGTCETRVLAGDVDHRDSILTPQEQATCATMMICVSRSQTPRMTEDEFDLGPHTDESLAAVLCSRNGAHGPSDDTPRRNRRARARTRSPPPQVIQVDPRASLAAILATEGVQIADRDDGIGVILHDLGGQLPSARAELEMRGSGMSATTCRATREFFSWSLVSVPTRPYAPRIGLRLHRVDVHALGDVAESGYTQSLTAGHASNRKTLARERFRRTLADTYDRALAALYRFMSSQMLTTSNFHALLIVINLILTGGCVMKREEHVVGDTFVYRYPGSAADHVLLVQHGTGGHGGVYDRFAAHYATLGAEVWCMDAPGHGRSCTDRPAGQFTLEEWVDAVLAMTDYIKTETGLPVFIKGSSLGTAAAYGAYASSDAYTGAVLMGFVIPSSPLIPSDNPFRTPAYEQMIAHFGDALRFDIGRLINFDEDYGFRGAGEQKHRDPLNTWTYDLASWASILRYNPAVPLAENTKPILYAVGEKDPIFPVPLAQAVVDATAGPVDFHIQTGGVHQLMLFHTVDYSRVVADWCRARLHSPAIASSPSLTKPLS
ncbi:alpha/beta fold hydrolase [Nocardia sp. NPDC055002]